MTTCSGQELARYVAASLAGKLKLKVPACVIREHASTCTGQCLASRRIASTLTQGS